MFSSKIKQKIANFPKKNTNYQVLAKVNLTGPALVTRQLLGQLRASRGSRVINLSSPCAHTRYCAV